MCNSAETGRLIFMVRMSFSSASEFESCPSKFYRRKILEEKGDAPPVFAFMYGTASHRKLGQFIQAAVAENFKPRDREELLMKLAEHMTEKQNGLCPGITTLMMGVYEKYGTLPKMELEYRLDLTADPEHEFLGFIDCVVNDEEIIDFKTGTIDRSLLDHYKKQLGLYVHYYKVRNGKEIRRVCIWSLRDGERIEIDAQAESEKAIVWYMAIRRDIHERLASKREFETIKSDECSRCEFKKNCKAWGV